MEGLEKFLLEGWTPGGVGIWTGVILGLVAWWKGLPAFLDSLANRQSKMEERMALLLQQTTDRFTRELEAADKRHEDCMKGQERLQERIEQLEEARKEDRRKIGELSDQRYCDQETIAGLKRQIVQLQVSAVRMEEKPIPAIIKDVVGKLDAIPAIGAPNNGKGVK